MHDGGVNRAGGLGRQVCAARSSCHPSYFTFEFDDIRTQVWGLQQFAATRRQGSDVYDFCFVGWGVL